ncbi:hypothetical protein QLL95_gp0429 [Cotonvirus japonicus]|uniref:Uncharacterized protein n=1 Tax=Cotonvirus japonicus TaxID=2811091 RepID=A0ABM7NU35_9VIRU|nr:hypothetical protein QLL95_gp0429 [Cotonvirus japonicus]BCS83694.1 hypothetical protein [Cotonvirus japonicus]
MNFITGCHQVITKLFKDSDVDGKTINLIQTVIASQVSCPSVEPMILHSISQFLEEIPEENFCFIESNVSLVDAKEIVKCIHIPTLIHALTDGGRMSKSNEIDLGNIIEKFFYSNDLFVNKLHPKVIVQTKSLKNGCLVNEFIPFVKYTRHDLIYMIVLVWRYILQRQDEVCYCFIV